MNDTPIHRVGIGTDLHRLAPGGPLTLGGLKLPIDQHLVGHSDADLVLHAVTDAILGAAGLPDIGEHFPDTDPANAAADSTRFLTHALAVAASRGLAPANVDVVIHAERPKLSPHKAAIRANVAALLGISEDRVSIKAKTNEGVDAIGRGEAMGCTCVVGMTHRIRA
ncbi:2-C-methyl-D-erythritol 2,4-cyclodiphosphate synthase [Phycisphaerae bacterium RAS2]|nr:2-C-methyl-D-erythritol 2,4-cyclodiphosphate synthase [Phycisphaerae bacterium RAS2]